MRSNTRYMIHLAPCPPTRLAGPLPIASSPLPYIQLALSSSEYDVLHETLSTVIGERACEIKPSHTDRAVEVSRFA